MIDRIQDWALFIYVVLFCYIYHLNKFKPKSVKSEGILSWDQMGVGVKRIKSTCSDDSLRLDPLMVEVVSTTIVVSDNALDSRQTKMMRMEKKFIKFPKSWELILLVRKHDFASGF